MRNIKNQIFMVFVGLLLLSCSKDKTGDNKTGVVKPSSETISAYPGNRRVKLSFEVKDKNVVSCEILWNNKAKSKAISLANRATDKVETFIEDLDEGVYTFEVYSYDKNRNGSVATVQSQSYGSTYGNTLKNREATTTSFIFGKPATLDWKPADVGEVFLEISYKDEADKDRKVRIKNIQTNAVLPAYKPNTPISYRSLYLPVYNAIDTFYTTLNTLPALPFYSTEVADIVNKSSLVTSVTSQSMRDLYNGVSYSTLAFKKANGEPLSLFIVKVDLSNKNISLSALLPNNQTTLGLQTVKLMAQARHNSGQKVLAAINADFFESGGKPLGPVFINGNAIKTTQSNPYVNYFAIRKDDTPIMGLYASVPASEYANIRDAVGGGVNMVVTNGVPCDYKTTDKEPRTVIGYNGNLVYMVVVDGRRAATSVGATLDQLGLMMSGLGCQQALNLDGGGSSTMVLKNVDNDEFNVVNAYSDANPRAVATSLGVIIK